MAAGFLVEFAPWQWVTASQDSVLDEGLSLLSEVALYKMKRLNKRLDKRNRQALIFVACDSADVLGKATDRLLQAQLAVLQVKRCEGLETAGHVATFSTRYHPILVADEAKSGGRVGAKTVAPAVRQTMYSIERLNGQYVYDRELFVSASLLTRFACRLLAAGHAKESIAAFCGLRLEYLNGLLDAAIVPRRAKEGTAAYLEDFRAPSMPGWSRPYCMTLDLHKPVWFLTACGNSAVTVPAMLNAVLGPLTTEESFFEEIWHRPEIERRTARITQVAALLEEKVASGTRLSKLLQAKRFQSLQNHRSEVVQAYKIARRYALTQASGGKI